MSEDYELLDSGDGAKLERFGEVILDRPSPQALWTRRLDRATWKKATARYERSSRGGGHWVGGENLPEQWKVRVADVLFRLNATGFGHLGVFPEQAPFWDWIRRCCRHEVERRSEPPTVLNLFAYTGGSTIAAAQGGAEVTHCDASKGVVRWASENAALDGLADAPIRWIIDDALKFLRREKRRERRYDGIILDPPSFGRGPKGQVFKLEEQIVPLLDACTAVLSEEPAFVLLSAHTPGLGPLSFRVLLEDALRRSHRARADAGHFGHGEMVLPGRGEVVPLPSGTWACWSTSTPPPEIEVSPP